MMEFLGKINGVDLLLTALAARTVYSAMNGGFAAEFIKNLGAIASVFIALHYYVRLAAYFTHLVKLPEPLTQSLSFVIIWLLVLFVFRYFREGLGMVFTVQTISVVDRWGAALICAVRFILTASLLLFLFLLTGLPYMQQITRASFSQKYILPVAPEVYRKITREFVTKFYPDEKVNKAVFDQVAAPGKR